MNIWNMYGFSENPYSTKPVVGDELGEKLLVGRERELRSLLLRMTSTDTHPTLEGENGVGKTSLAAVAGYRLYQAWSQNESQQALIPMREPLQLTKSETAADFRRRVFMKVAQTFIEHADDLKARGHSVPDISSVNLWLNNPVAGGYGLGVSAPTLGGASANKTSIPNSSVGYSEDGFSSAIRSWLVKCFPTLSAGAFIGIIDNLELLESSKDARVLLEELRDDVLGLPGMRWVLCGARGIIRSAASTPRLHGVLAEPLEIKPVKEEFVGELIDARLGAFSIRDDLTVPVDAAGFKYIHRVGNKNLRNAMKYSEDFSVWVADESVNITSPEKRVEQIERYMSKQSQEALSSSYVVPPAAWQLFDQLARAGGQTSPGAFEEYGFDNHQAMRPYLKQLEESNLIESTIDDADLRRRTINITSRGWIVHHQRSGGYASLASDSS